MSRTPPLQATGVRLTDSPSPRVGRDAVRVPAPGSACGREDSNLQSAPDLSTLLPPNPACRAESAVLEPGRSRSRDRNQRCFARVRWLKCVPRAGVASWWRLGPCCPSMAHPPSRSAITCPECGSHSPRGRLSNSLVRRCAALAPRGGGSPAPCIGRDLAEDDPPRADHGDQMARERADRSGRAPPLRAPPRHPPDLAPRANHTACRV